MRRLLPAWTLLLAAAAAPQAAAHGGEHGSQGPDLLVGDQPVPDGELVVVPFVRGDLCAAFPPTKWVAAGDAEAQFAANATHVAVALHGVAGFTAAALASGSSVRSLVAMAETDTTLHAFVAVVPRGEAMEARQGEAGVSNPVEGTDPLHAAHAFIDSNLNFAYSGPATPCPGEDPVVLTLPRPEVGPLVHAFVVSEPLVQDFLLHPLPSTAMGQAVLYFAAEGEEPADVERALSTRPTGAELLPVLAGGVAAVGLAWRVNAASPGSGPSAPKPPRPGQRHGGARSRRR